MNVQLLVGALRYYISINVTSATCFDFDDDPITSKLVVEITFVKKWQRNTSTVYEYDKNLHL
jgi:hypothetical protein